MLLALRWPSQASETQNPGGRHIRTSSALCGSRLQAHPVRALHGAAAHEVLNLLNHHIIISIN